MRTITDLLVELLAEKGGQGLIVGAPANVALVAAGTLAEVVAGVPPRQTVIAHGQPVVIDGVPQPLLHVEAEGGSGR